MSVLVIDVGTSGLRAAIVRPDASVVAVTYEASLPSSPAPGLVEFDADGLGDAVLRVARRCLAEANCVVSAVGITAQRASAVLWRASTGRACGPALGWQDLRTIFDCIMAKSQHGVALAPNQTATKASWMLANYIGDESERASNDLRIGTVDSWIVHVLTQGRVHVTDNTNAAVTGLADATATKWDERVVDALLLHLHQLPRIVPSVGYIGDATALPGSPPIFAIAGDQQASLVGQGCITSGQTKITFGTGGMLDMYVGAEPPKSATRSGHGTFPIVAFSDETTCHYGLEAIMLSAGTNVEWLVEDMGLAANAAQTHDIASTCATSEGVVYVPALMGLGTPYWDYGARGSLFGITRGTSRAHVVRAVLEGVAHRGVDLVEAAEAESGLTIDELRIDGGMSRNPTFVQALADASGRPVRVSAVTEATTLGAGFLAGVGAGQWRSLSECSANLVPASIVAPLGAAALTRPQWKEAISRSRAWIPDLSALDF